MNSKLERMLNLIEELYRLNIELGRILEMERSAIVENNLAKINTAQAEKESRLMRIRKTESARIELVAEIAKLSGDIPGTLTMSRLGQMTDSVTAKKLTSSAKRLLDAVMSNRMANEHLGRIVRSVSGRNMEAYSFLRKVVEPASTYGVGGDYKSNISHGKMLSRQA